VTTFTVVMAARDTRATVGAAIRSVLAQTRGDFELVVIDDGSSDGTPDVVRGFAGDERVRLVELPRSGGAAAARAAGIEAGGGELVSLIDSDDLWMPGYLEAMGAALDADPGAGFAYTDAWYLDDRSRRIRRVSAMGYQRPPEPPPASASELFDALVERNFVFNAVTVRRAAIDAAGPPDARLRSMIDWEWWLRLAATGHRAIRVPGRLGVYRLRPESLSRDPLLVASGQRDLWRTVAEEYDLPDDRRRELRARAARFDAEVEALSGRRRLALAAWRARRRVAAARARLRRSRDYYVEPPAELLEAFGDLRAV
jgi:glycosyltransferase involved in cell wall biosynthesis